MKKEIKNIFVSKVATTIILSGIGVSLVVPVNALEKDSVTNNKQIEEKSGITANTIYQALGLISIGGIDLTTKVIRKKKSISKK